MILYLKSVIRSTSISYLTFSSLFSLSQHFFMFQDVTMALHNKLALHSPWVTFGT